MQLQPPGDGAQPKTPRRLNTSQHKWQQRILYSRVLVTGSPPGAEQPLLFEDAVHLGWSLRSLQLLPIQHLLLQFFISFPVLVKACLRLRFVSQDRSVERHKRENFAIIMQFCWRTLKLVEHFEGSCARPMGFSKDQGVREK